MNHYELSKELIKIREQYYHQEYTDETTRNYFDGSVKQIHNYFMNSKWRNNYLFFSMGYFDNRKTNLIQYQYNTDNGCMTPFAIELMESLTQKWINVEGSISITEMFLHEKNQGEHYKALFYKLNDKRLNDKLDEFIYLNLSEINWDISRDMAKFESTDFTRFNYGKPLYLEFKKHGNKKNPFLSLINDPTENDIREFNRLISIYLEIINEINDSCFFYFIKPHTFQNEFNGILTFGLKIELSPDEIELWIDKAQRIIDAIATKKMAYLTKLKTENERISRSHTLKTQIKANLLKPIQELTSSINDKRLEVVEENINQLFTLLDLQSLVDKVENKKRFIVDSQGKKLFSNEIKTVEFDRILAAFNEGMKSRSASEIIIKGETRILTNELFKVYGLYPEVLIVENFLNTVFENIEGHGAEFNNEKELIITKTSDGWIFKNRVIEKLQSDIENFTGSISEFNLLLTRSKSGKIEMKFTEEDSIVYFNLNVTNL